VNNKNAPSKIPLDQFIPVIYRDDLKRWQMGLGLDAGAFFPLLSYIPVSKPVDYLPS